MTPWALAALPIAWYLVWRWLRDDRRAARWAPRRRGLVLGLRLALIALLVLSLSGIRLNFMTPGQAVVFLVDASASLRGARDEIASWVRQSLTSQGGQDRAGIAVFGGQAAVDLPLGSEGTWTGPETAVDPGQTDLESGLRLAGALLPADARRRVVVVSDGRPTLGDPLEEANWLFRRGVRVDVVPAQGPTGPEVLIRELRAPPQLYEGEIAQLEVDIESNVPNGALVRVFRDGQPVAEERTALSQGSNRMVFALRADRSGFQTFRIDVSADRDTSGENNSFSAISHVRGIPRVLLVEGAPGRAAELGRLLSSGGAQVRVVPASEIPSLENGLSGYGAVFLVDVAAADIGDRRMEDLKLYVRDVGGGLVMTGGQEAFGLGGYWETPVEEALPVYMDLRGKARIPSLGLMLVIDKSGSMSSGPGGISKMDLAKEAAVRSTQILTPKDSLGVVAFDGAAKWVVNFAPVEDRKKIKEAIGGIYAGGGTNIYPGLQMAYEALKEASTKLKHVILLTDGVSAFGGNYAALAEEMKARDITMTTVAVGYDSDVALLEWLAKIGRGRYYFTNDFTTIPKIVTRETVLATRSYIVEQSFMPALGTPGPLTDGLNGLVRQVDGYIATTAKETAEVALVSQEGDPVLAAANYGLGRSVAWTPDTAGRWTGPWVGSDQWQSLWGGILSWVLPRAGGGALEVAARTDGDLVKVTAKGDPATVGIQAPELTATVSEFGRSEQKIALRPAAPGRWEGEIRGLNSGAYLIRVDGSRTAQNGSSEPQSGGAVPETKVATGTGGLVVPYSSEYRHSGTDLDFLRRLAEAGGGKLLERPEEAFADDLPQAARVTDLWPWLLAAAALLLPLDIAARRFPVFSGARKVSIQRLSTSAADSKATPVARAVPSAASEIDALRPPSAGPREAPRPMKTVPPPEDFTDRLLRAKRKPKK